jgi:hypothetical protein
MTHSDTTAREEAGTPAPPGAEALKELIERKRKQWDADKGDVRKNRLEGLWMSLFGLAIVALSFFLFGDLVNKARVMVLMLGLGVTGFGIYFMVTGRALPEDPQTGGR